jgi:hypothetical protein
LEEEDSSAFKRRDSPSPKGNNSEGVKIHKKFLKIFFTRTRAKINQT